VVAKPRALRSDAQRNRELVLEVARQAFEADGLGVPIDDIARRAGLGIGTVYRHFPTKQDLIAAIVTDRMELLAREASALGDDADPGGAFLRFLESMAVEFARKRYLGESLSTSVDIHAATEVPRKQLRAGLAKLLRRAQQAGTIRADVQMDDVFALIKATLPTPDRPHPASARLLAIVCAGLRA
jgi:AcrR family transcriptional regulator